MKLAVIGHPIAHSKSPTIHQYWLAQNNILGSYDAIDIIPEKLPSEIQKMTEAGYSGFNVTIPHKQVIMNLCEEVDKTAQKIGAVNTIIVKDKKLYGYNTDAFGFVENIKSTVPEFIFKDKIVVFLGAGGAARAALYGLLEQNVQKIKISNRTQDKAEALKKMAPDIIEVIAWEDREKSLEGADLLVNTTSLGMEGGAGLDLDLRALPVSAVVSDIVYAPLMTALLKQSQDRGNIIVTGIGMLLHQARGAFKIWTDILPEITTELEQKILR